MWKGSHETPVDLLKRHIKGWKMRGPAGDGSQGHWSDETICDFIVAAHARIDGPARTGIVFAMPGTTDEARRQKANAAKILRYITDEPNTEFGATQLLNLLPSILAAMPDDLATGFLNEYLSPVNRTVRGIDADDSPLQAATAHLVKIARETSEAQVAVADLIDGATPEELSKAERELAEAEEAIRSARADIHRRRSLKAVQ